MSAGKVKIYIALIGLCFIVPILIRDLWSTFAARREFEVKTGIVGCAALDSVRQQQKFMSRQAYFLAFCVDGVEGKFKVKADEAGFDRLQGKLSVGDTVEVTLNKRERETDGYLHAWGLKRNGAAVFGVEDKAKEKRGELAGILRLLALLVVMVLSFYWVRRMRRKRSLPGS